jgi:hypothetical protein
MRPKVYTNLAQKEEEPKGKKNLCVGTAQFPSQ